MRVVFDTNLIISGLIWSGAPRRALQIAMNQRVEAITSEALVDELRDVLKRDKFHKYLERLQRTPEELVTDYLRYTRVIEPALVPEDSIRDIADVKVLAAAVGGQAVYIVSGDEDILILKNFTNITILNVQEFIQRIG